MSWTSPLLSGWLPVLIDSNSRIGGQGASWQRRWHFRRMSVKQMLFKPWTWVSCTSKLLSGGPFVLINSNFRLHGQGLHRKHDILEKWVPVKSSLYHGVRCPDCHNCCKDRWKMTWGLGKSCSYHGVKFFEWLNFCQDDPRSSKTLTYQIPKQN